MQKTVLKHPCSIMARLEDIKQALAGMGDSSPDSGVALRHIQSIESLKIDKSNAKLLINHLLAVFGFLKNTDLPNKNTWCLQLDSLCDRLTIPPGEFRFAKLDAYRRLRVEQLALTWRDTEEISASEFGMLQLLTQTAELFASEQSARPRVMIRYQSILGADQSDRWIVTFLYDLISHLELAGIQTLVWRQSSKDCYADVKQDFEMSNYHEIDLSTELGCKCLFTVPNNISNQDFQFIAQGYLRTLKLLIEKLYNTEHNKQAFGQLWEKQDSYPLSTSIKISQFMPDKCSLMAIVEPRLDKLDLLSTTYNESLPIAHGTQHVLVTQTDPMQGPEVNALPGADIRIGTIHATIMK